MSLPLKSVVIILFLTHCTIAIPTFKVPVVVDDGDETGIVSAMNMAFLAEHFNSQIDRYYPFDIRLDIRFRSTMIAETFIDMLHLGQDNSTNVVLGPTHSSTVSLSSGAIMAYEIPSIVWYASSETFSSVVEFPYLWRAGTPDSGAVKAFATFTNAMLWRHVILLTDYQTSFLSHELSKPFQDMGITTLQFRFLSSQATDIASVLEDVRSTNYKIILLAGSFFSSKILNIASQMGMIGPHSGYVWNTFTAQSKNLQLLAGGFSLGDLILGPLTNIFLNDQSSMDKAYAQVEALYEGISRPPAIQNGLIPPAPAILVPKAAFPPRSAFPTTSMEFIYGMQPCRAMGVALEVQRQALLNNPESPMLNRTEFQAALLSFSGDIFGFSDYHLYVNSSSSHDIHIVPVQILNYRAGGSVEPVAVYAGAIEWFANVVSIFPDGSPNIPDDGIVHESLIHINSAEGILVLTTMSILLALVLITAVLLARFWYSPIIALSTPISLVINLLGIVLLMVSPMWELLRSSRAVCAAEVWTPYIGIILCLGTSITRSLKTLLLLIYARRENPIVFTKWKLIIVNVLLLLPAIILLMISTLHYPGIDQRILSANGDRIYVICKWPTPSVVLQWIVFGYVVAISVVDLLLAFSIRNAPRGLNNSADILRMEYAVVLTFLLCNLIANVSAHPIVSDVFFSMGTVLPSICILSALYFPRFYIAIFKPELNTLGNLLNVEGLKPNQTLSLESDSARASRID